MKDHAYILRCLRSESAEDARSVGRDAADLIELMRDALETTQTALLEVRHAYGNGMDHHVQMWVRQGLDAAREALARDEPSPPKN